MTVKDTIYTALLQGYIDFSTNFYFLFLASIMIAYDNRHTQEITATGTIITVYGLTSQIFSGGISLMIA